MYIFLYFYLISDPDPEFLKLNMSALELNISISMVLLKWFDPFKLSAILQQNACMFVSIFSMLGDSVSF